MAISLVLRSAALGAVMAVSPALWAVDCAQVIWAPQVLERYPNIYNLCQAVVEREGKQYVEVQAKFVSYHDHKARVHFKTKDGTYDKIFETKELPDDFKVTVGDKRVLASQLEPETELTMYVPSNRFALVSDLALVTALYDFEDEPVPAEE